MKTKRFFAFVLAFVLLLTSVPFAFASGVTYSLSTEEQDVFINGTYKRKLTTVPAGADTSSAVWLSSDESVAAVDEDGTVHALQKGTAVIMVEIGGETFSYRVCVVEPILSSKTEKLYLGNQTTLTVRGGSGKVRWKTSDKKIATVKNGVVTAKKVGKATITATRNGFTMQCKVTVLKPAFKNTKLNIQLGEKAKLKVNGGTQKPVFKSSDPSIVYVNANGRVLGKKLGKATVTATVDGYTLRCTVTVFSHMLNRSSLTLEAGSSQTLTVIGGSGKTTWKSSNTKVASVNAKGVVTGKSAGTANIIATKNGFNLVCKVTVRVTDIDVPEGKENIVSAYCEAINKAKNTKNFKLRAVSDPSFTITKSGETADRIIYTILLETFFADSDKSYTFKNGKTDGNKSPTAVIPPLYQSCNLSAKGVSSAKAKKDGSGYIIEMNLVKEKAYFSGTGSNSCVHNKAVSMPLNLSVLQIADDDELADITVTYTKTNVVAKIDNRGRITSLVVTAPQIFRVNTNFEAKITDKDTYTFSY